MQERDATSKPPLMCMCALSGPLPHFISVGRLVATKVFLELLFGQKGTVQRLANLCLVHVGANENKLCAPVSMAALDVLLGSWRPLRLRRGCDEPPAQGAK